VENISRPGAQSKRKPALKIKRIFYIPGTKSSVGVGSGLLVPIADDS